jgi:hypothetical protein
MKHDILFFQQIIQMPLDNTSVYDDLSEEQQQVCEQLYQLYLQSVMSKQHIHTKQHIADTLEVLDPTST